ncbi:DUF6603 domain-containing protein [Streptomyces sp. CBMA123]|uniref:DUF6603 domain-containing protein n=1 Tax=Streptomyces sp. CBMA123 TaxID=1896313 RepID=UPI0016619508|nr:DUF6603 domain-containing protein [Streptomyces sp. CBMA123]
MSVADLLDSFPAQGEDFVLRLDLFELPELYELLGTGKELVLKEAEVLRDQLTVAGQAVLLQGERMARLTLRFVADAANAFVTGVTARVDAALELIELATAWAVDLAEAPLAFLGELRELAAHYELTVGSVAITAQTERLRLVFATPKAGSGLTAMIGIRGSDAYLSRLPYIGGEIPRGDEVGVRGVELVAVGPGGVDADQGAALNTAVAAAVGGEPNWPLMPDQDLAAGLWVGASFALPDQDPRVCLTELKSPTSVHLRFPQVSLGHWHLSAFQMTWSRSGDGVIIYCDLGIDLGWLALTLPSVGFMFGLPPVGDLPLTAQLPTLSLRLGGRELRFRVSPGPGLPDWPGLPGLPGPGVLTGWWSGQPSLALPDLAELFGLTLPPLPEVFTPELPSLGLRFDVRSGEFALTGLSSWLRGVFAALPAGPDWSVAWGKVALLGLGDLTAKLGDLPFIGGLIGDLIPDLDFGLNGITLASIGPGGLTPPQIGRLNDWLRSLPDTLGSWWPKLPEGAGPAGAALALDWRLPGLPSLDWAIPWPPPAGVPGVSWKDLPQLNLGPLGLPRIGLTWPGPGEPGGGGGSGSWLRLVFDADFDLGGITIGLPGLGFDVDFTGPAIRPRFPSVSLRLPGGVDLVLAVPQVPGPPWPFALTAVWEDEEGVSAADLAAALGLDLSGLPPMLVPQLFQAAVHYDFRTSVLLVTAVTRRLGWVLASEPVTGTTTRRYAVAVRGRVSAKASDLPLVGESITPDHDVALTGIALAYASAPWPVDRVEAVNTVLGEIDTADPQRLPRLPDEALVRGALAWADLTADGQTLPPLIVRLPDTVGLALPSGAPVDVASGGAVVLGRERGEAARELDLRLGPVHLRQVSLGYSRGRLFLAFDATLTLGPVALDPIGLGLAVDQEFTVIPVLSGAGVRVAVPPLKVSGVLEVRQDPAYEVYIAGLAAVEIGFFAMQAAGSYARSVDGWSSLFLFGELTGGEQGLFGPPPFRVIGISLGFGVNSTVRTPTIDQVGEFPLVNRLDGSGSGDTPAQVLEKLAGPGGWITPREGQYWGAGGIEFSSFEFLRSRALLLVEGGESWKVLLIGRTTIDLPRNKAAKKPIARLVIDLAIGYHHDQGLFSMDAVIAPGSYVIDPAAELTGGLSLYIWGQDRTAAGGGKGFVFTLGGYHPRFKRPAYYPDPPRVGWRWAIGPVAIRGQVYAALTDGAFMAGGELAATYDKGHGIQLQAWFTAWLDALVQWKPFYFDLSMGLNIGVAATVKVLFIRVRISLEVGVALDLWGPPIGGRARIKVWFISFTVEFGTGRDGVPAIDWAEFSVQLPAPLSIAPLRGLLVDVDPEESALRSATGEPLLVSMDGFAVRTEAAVPASRIILNGDTFAGAAADTIDIRPMGPKGQGVVSEHHITLTRLEGPYTPTGWTVAVYWQDMPKAMWGAPLGEPGDVLDGDGLLSGCLAGLTFEIPKPELAPAVGWVDAEALDVDGLPDAPIARLGSAPEGPPSTVGDGSIAAIVDPATGIAAATTATRRASVHAALAGLGLAPGTDDPLTRYADLAQTVFTSAPMTTTAER